MKYKTKIYQDRAEFDRFLELIKTEKIKSYLEIGSHIGGSFWQVTNTLPTGARVVSVDLPDTDANGVQPSKDSLVQCVDELKRCGYDAHLFLGDSTDASIVHKVGKLAPFDLCLIDGNHTEPFVLADWSNYGPMASIVAFHDIGWPDSYRHHQRGMPAQVPRVWNKAKQDFQSTEIVTQRGEYGIGVLWRQRPV